MASVNTTRSLADMNEVNRLRAHLLDLGMNFSIWDAAGSAVGCREFGSEFCRNIKGCMGCQGQISKIASTAISKGQPTQCLAACGCGIIGVPVFQRRRILGAVVSCFPTRQMAQEATLKELCQNKNLNYATLKPLADLACRFSAENVGRFLKVLSWMLKEEQDVAVANQEITTLSTNLANTYEELSLVYRISSSMQVTQRPNEFLQNVCNELAEVINVSGVVAISYAHPAAGQEDELVISGDVDLNAEQIKLLASVHLAPRMNSSENRGMLDNHFRPSPESGLGNSIRNVIAAPLMGDKAIIGMIIAFNRREGDFDSVDLKLVNSIGSQTAVFLANHRLYADLQDLLMGVLHALTATIDAKDPYTCGHSQRVAIISRRLAELMGCDEKKVHQIYLMGLLHDIGKIGVPESVLCKPGKLTEEEFETIKRHPAIGAKILGGIRQLDDIVSGILTHHERPDGKGYPRGLKGSEIPLEGLIVGLADCFDAMTSNRTYRNALPLSVVLAEIRKHAGSQFHPELVEKFLGMNPEAFLREIHQPVKAVFPAAIPRTTSPDQIAVPGGSNVGDKA